MKWVSPQNFEQTGNFSISLQRNLSLSNDIRRLSSMELGLAAAATCYNPPYLRKIGELQAHWSFSWRTRA